MVSVKTAITHKRLVAFGDSWTYGSELADPSVPNNRGDYDTRNDAYRLSNAWPARLGKLMSADEVINLGTAARSNDTISRDLTAWLATEGYLSGRDTKGLLVCIGWTSPERKDFFFIDPQDPSCTDQGWVTMYPMWKHKYKHDAIDEFTEHYVRYWWNAEEFMHRYINQVHAAQVLLKSLSIRYVMFQAIYHHHALPIAKWRDDAYAKQNYQNISEADKLIWSQIDPHRFMHKDEPLITFHNWMLGQVGWDRSQVLLDNHPNEKGHGMWAKHMLEWVE